MQRWDTAIWRYFLFRGTLSRAYLPILVVYMLDRGLSLEQIALTVVIGQVASLIFEVPSGAIADTLGHRKTLTIAMLGEAASSLLFLGGSLSWIIAATLTYFLFAALQSGTSEALFFEYLKATGRKDEHLALLGQGKALAWTMNMLVVLIGGATYALHPAIPFVGCALIFVGGALAISGFPQAQQTTSVGEREGFVALLNHFPRGIKTIIAHPYVFWLVVVNALLIGVISGSNEFQQVIFTDLGATTFFIGIVYAAKRGLSILLSGYAYRLKPIPVPTLMTCFTVATGLFMVATPFVHSFALYGLLVLCSVVTLALLDVLFNDLLNHAIPTLSRATTLSIASFVKSIISILAAASFGWWGTSAPQTFGLLGIAVIILAIFPLLRIFQTTHYSHTQPG